MISDEETQHSLTVALDLFEQKEYAGGKKIVRSVRNKIQKKVEEQKRVERKTIAQAEAIIKEKEAEKKND